MLGKIRFAVFIGFAVSFICIVWGLGSAAEPPVLARLSGAEKERVAKLIEGAKKEGELIGYSGALRPDVQSGLFSKFREEYGFSEADLRLKIISTRSATIAARINEELRAKVFKTDVIHDSIINWFNDLVAKGALMPYNCPEYKNFSPLSVNPEVAPANPPYFISSQFSIYAILYNPKYVKGEIIHWKDVLRPEYKGKISCGDLSKSPSYIDGCLVIRKILDTSFFRELGKQDPFVLVSASDLVNKAITGEYPIVVISSQGPAFRANLKGAGLKLVFPPEGCAAGGYTMAVLANPPHPNASKLFMDFYHSESAQKIMLESGFPIGRLGLKSKYPEFPVPIYDLKGYTPIDWRKIGDQERDNMREEFRRLVIERK